MRRSELTDKQIEDNLDEEVLVECVDCEGLGRLRSQCTTGIEDCCFSCSEECDTCEGSGKISQHLWEIGDDDEFEFEL